MKNATRCCAGPAYYRMCSTDVAVQNKPAAVAPKETITIISSFLELGRKKTVSTAKIYGGAENVVKAKPANVRKWIARFYYFGHLYHAGPRVCAHNNFA